MCARVIRDEIRCATLRNTGQKLGFGGFWMGNILTLTLRPPRKSIPPETRYLAQKNGVDPLKNVVSKGGQVILFKKLKITQIDLHISLLFTIFGMWFHIADVITRVKF